MYKQVLLLCTTYTVTCKLSRYHIFISNVKFNDAKYFQLLQFSGTMGVQSYGDGWSIDAWNFLKGVISVYRYSIGIGFRYNWKTTLKPGHP
jgi:hypothetical protein